MLFLYAHGFASSPQSRKAQFFRSAFAAHGIDLLVPVLDEGDFAHLTISRQLAVMERAIGGQPVRLIGSSMGGYLAALYASLHPETDRLVLLAPAFEFAPAWNKNVEPGEPLEVFHYGENTIREVHYELLADALRHPASPDFSQPAIIFHGIHDDVVPVEHSRAFTATHPNAELQELESDHELLNVLDHIVGLSLPFLR